MTYINPKDKYASRHRRDVAYYARRKGVRTASRYYGIPPGTVSKWMKKAERFGHHPIPTESSKPKNHPHTISEKVIDRIVELRFETNGRCAEVIHGLLQKEKVRTSLNTVRRTLDRKGLVRKRSHLKRRHIGPSRPHIAQPGDLIQIDTIHLMKNDKERIYVFTLIDVHSRWTYAWASERANARTALLFLYQAKRKSPMLFNLLQSDNGPEFSQNFTERVRTDHRHSRVRRPNDNAHIERFNRTIQEELLDHLPRDVKIINKELPKYLNYYNTERLHLGINLKTPLEVIKCFQAIG
jgi:transposase InsO family protein